MPGFSFPPVGPLGHGSPPSRPSTSGRRYYDQLRLPLHLLGSLRFRSIPDTLRAPVGSCSSRLAGGLGAARPTPGRFCIPVCRSRSSTTRSWRFSQVPGLPLWVHAPLASDSGGVPDVCHDTSGTHAFQRFKTVGFPHPRTGYPCFPYGPQLYLFRSSVTRPALLLHPASHTPC
jgi:hypothetical protein